MRRPRRIWVRFLEELIEWLTERVPGEPVTFMAGLSQAIYHTDGKVEVTMGEITVPAGSTNLHATVQFLDADGNPTTPDQTPTWTSNDEAVATVRASADGLSAEVTPVAAGSAVIECVAVEQDPEVEIRATGMVNVLAADASPDAVVGEITFSPTEVGGGPIVEGGEGGGEAR